jgi:hypothetical protein
MARQITYWELSETTEQRQRESLLGELIIEDLLDGLLILAQKFPLSTVQASHGRLWIAVAGLLPRRITRCRSSQTIACSWCGHGSFLGQAEPVLAYHYPCRPRNSSIRKTSRHIPRCLISEAVRFGTPYIR